MQPLTNEIYAALKEAERRRKEEVLTYAPRRRTSILNDY
tara:strand:+ start:241 stop:357 length:117 start_codon:yes stop_codon:yes gene_type:complete